MYVFHTAYVSIYRINTSYQLNIADNLDAEACCQHGILEVSNTIIKPLFLYNSSIGICIGDAFQNVISWTVDISNKTERRDYSKKMG